MTPPPSYPSTADGRSGSSPSVRWPTAYAAGLTTLGLLPATLLSAQAVLLEDDLSFSESRLGIAVSVYFMVAAVVVLAAGQLVERVGYRRGTALAAGLAAVSVLGIAAAGSYPQVLAFLAIGGCANATAHVSSNLLVAEQVPVRRQGLAFGTKQAAIPIALLASGAAVPLLGTTFGWRTAFVLAGVVGATVAVLSFGREAGSGRTDDRSMRARVALQPLVVIAFATAIASAMTNALGAFLVAWAVTTGLSVGAAGVLLACASGIGVAARIGAGAMADRRSKGNLRVVAVQLFASAVGLALLAVGGPVWLIIGSGLAFLGWSWPGLLVLAVVRTHRGSPAAATSVVQSGAFLGGAVGPALFGVLVGVTSYPVAWRWAAVFLVLSAFLVLLGRRLLLARVGAPVPAADPGGHAGR